MRARRGKCTVAAILLAGFAFGVDVAPAAAAVVGVTVAGGNGQGSAADQLHNPFGVAVDHTGNLYVADAFNNRVQRWAPGATTGVTVAGGNGSGPADDQLASPFGVALDGDGNVYVADYGNNRVQQWAPGATTGVTVAGGNGSGSADDQVQEPVAVAVDDSGNVYVTEGYLHRVQRWAPGATSGATVAGGNGSGAAADQLDTPYGVAVDLQGSIYVADQGNHRVQQWAPGATSGVTVAGGNGMGVAADQLTIPIVVTVDADGYVYVSDRGNNRVQQWAPGASSGVTVAGGRGRGAGPGQFDEPEGVALDLEGRIYVADRLNERVQRWPSVGVAVVPGSASAVEGDGTTAIQVPVTLSHPSSATVTAQWGTIYVSGAPAGQADPDSDYTAVSGSISFAPGETEATVSIPVRGDVWVEPDEYVVVSFHDPVNAQMGGFWGLGFGAISNDDHATVLPGIASGLEGDSATTVVELPLTLSNPSVQAVMVEWDSIAVPGAPDHQADPTTDYDAASGTVTFAPGETEATVSIPVRGDVLVEPDEYVVVSFHDPVNARMGGFWGLGFVVITNDD